MNGPQMNDWTIWVLLVSVLVGVIGHFFVYRILSALTRRTKNTMDNLFIKHCYRPLQWIAVLFVIQLFLPLKLSEEYLTIAKQGLSLLFIGLISFLLIKTTYVLDAYIINRFDIDQKDNLGARKVRTQLNV